MPEPSFQICQLNDIPEVPCPCGQTRRAFTDDADGIASLHLVTTQGEARSHFHKKMTEIYYFLEGEGEMELDGVGYSVRPGTAVLIKPGCRHRAIGKMKFINIPVPAFDPEDEWFE